MPGPLEGVRVLDASIMAAGPWVGALLGQLGADVIKVEPPAGDGTRWVQPLQRGMGTNYICLNTNKRGITLDFKSADGKANAIALAQKADIFIQNFRGGVIERLGLGYETLSQVNPGLIYCSVTGFGEAGPLAKEACADFVMQAFSGFARLNGANCDELEAFRFTGYIDLTTSIVATEAVLAALLRREMTGNGQKIEISMLQAALEMQATRIAEMLGAGSQLAPLGSASPGLAPDRAYQALDGEVFVSVQTGEQWRGFCAAIEQPQLADDARLTTTKNRVANRAALESIIEPIIRPKPVLWWMRIFERHGVPVAFAHHIDALRHHAQVRENQMIAELDTPDWGRVMVGGLPWHFSGTPCRVTAPTVPGAATEAVLAELSAKPSPARKPSKAERAP